MLSPKQFELNEAWVLFRLNKSPIRTDVDGNFDCIAFMDAASGFLCCAELMCVEEPEAWKAQARHLLKRAKRQHKLLPKTILATKGVLADLIRSEAMRQGIDVISVASNQLLALTSEPRQAFAQHLERDSHR
jgi:hypothetical protein